MLPTPEISVWSSSARLTSVCLPRSAGDERLVVEERVHRVAGDVRDLGGQLGAALGDRQAAERALVDEAQLAGRRR